jgi:hypothetical protein
VPVRRIDAAMAQFAFRPNWRVMSLVFHADSPSRISLSKLPMPGDKKPGAQPGAPSPGGGGCIRPERRERIFVQRPPKIIC